MKIEVGKKYRRRDGEIVRVERINTLHESGETHPFMAGARSYRENGSYYFDAGDECDLDLIEEIVEQAPAVEAPQNAYAAALNDGLAQLLGPVGPIHYAPPAIEPTDLLAALRMLLREVDAGTSGGRIRIDGSAALIDAATLARSVIQRHAP